MGKAELKGRLETGMYAADIFPANYPVSGFPLSYVSG